MYHLILSWKTLLDTSCWKRQYSITFKNNDTLQENSVNLDCFEHFSQFLVGFTMVVYEKVYLEAYINNTINS